MDNIRQKLQRVKNCQPQLADLAVAKRNLILTNLAGLLVSRKAEILRANGLDLKNLKRQEMRDRLVLNEKRINGMALGLHKLAALPDPLNKILEKKKLGNGLLVEKISVPLGVAGVIYESRPNVTTDLAALAIKSGNGLVLKGGSESYHSNKVLVGLVGLAVKRAGLPAGLVYLIKPGNDWQTLLLNAHGLVDVIIPRGSQRLIEWVRENSRLPVIETGAGVCHIFVDAGAGPDKAAEIIVNAKVQRPDVCNALDTLVIHHKALGLVLPLAAKKLALHRVEIMADAPAFRILSKIYPAALLRKAKPSDYGVEFLSLKMSVKTVASFGEGLKYVGKNTSGHSEAILSPDKKHIAEFFKKIDAAVVYANASTRFTDGEEFGMGAEAGVSTQKLHARGPMGLQALTSYKWLAYGKGQVRK